ncbi:MAG TPA: DUF6788 family protein [Propionibacteriaceae bacterium]|jgi:hypothetical protein
MARSTKAGRLADSVRRHRDNLASQLVQIGLIAAGSVTRRYTRCGTAGCRCHADPPQPHGPCYQWTAKLNGKTVTRRLTDREAALSKEWLANDRQLRAVIGQMRRVAAKAGELIIAEVADT